MRACVSVCERVCVCVCVFERACVCVRARAFVQVSSLKTCVSSTYVDGHLKHNCELKQKKRILISISFSLTFTVNANNLVNRHCNVNFRLKTHKIVTVT